MPVTDQTTSNSSTGNGVTTVYPYTYKILDEADILVEVDGVAKTLTTHYTVSGVGVSGGGNVTFVTAPASGAVVVLSRSMAYSRDTDYQESGDLLAATLDEDVDRVTMLVQQVRQLIRRAVKLPAGVTTDQVLPSGNTVVERASKIIGFDAAGAPALLAAADVSLTTVSAFIATLFDDADAASARTTLGARGIADDVPLAAGKAVIFEGTTDDAFETTLTVVDPTADRTATLPNKSGTIAMLDDVVSVMPRSYLAGYGLANNVGDATNDIDIAVGAARDSTNAADITLASALTKRLDAAWAVGTNAGGLDTGSIANTTYHVWAIKRSDTGVVDVLFSTSATAPTMPANYDYKRRIGSIVRTGAAIKAFTQDGDYFRWTATVLDINDTITAATSRTLTVPTGLNVFAFGSATMESGIGTPFLYLSDLAASDEAPANNAAPLGAGSVNTALGQGGCFWEVRTNTSAQIRSRIGAAGGATTLRIATYGWYDTRGRNN